MAEPDRCLTLLLFLVCVCALQGVEVLSTQQRLVADILDMYDTRVKPTRLAQGTVNVTFRLDLYQIIQVNEREQYIVLNAWIGEEWQDELLFWDPEEYDNVTDVNLPYDVIWTPDTTLYNSLVMKDDETRRLMTVKLKTDVGRRAVHVTMMYPTMFTFSCTLALLDFPFDDQNCTLSFGSWTYDEQNVNFFPKPIDRYTGLENYVHNEGWAVTDFQGYRHSMTYNCCVVDWALLKYHLSLRRKPLFYIVNLIIPTLIITLISIIGFFMPSTATGERHEKVSLGITTLLSMSILLLMVSHEMPTTSSSVPLIGWFYLCMIIIISLGTIMSSVVIIIHKKGQFGDRVSHRKVFALRLVSLCVFVPVPQHLESPREAKSPPKFSEATEEDAMGWGKVVWLLRSGLKMKSKKDVFAQEKVVNDSEIRLLQKPLLNTLRWRAAKTSIIDQLNDHKAHLDHGQSFRKSDINGNNKTDLALAAKEERVFAAREYEWYATVVERVCFVFFVSLLAAIVGYTCYRSLLHSRRLAAEPV